MSFMDRVKKSDVPSNTIKKKTETKTKTETTSKKRKSSSKEIVNILIDEFQQIKKYLRNGEKRPSQTEAVKNFEKHLKLLL